MCGLLAFGKSNIVEEDIFNSVIYHLLLRLYHGCFQLIGIEIGLMGNKEAMIGYSDSATLEHGMHPPVKPKPEWRAIMDEMALISTEEYRSIVFKEPKFIEYFHSVSLVIYV